MSKHYWIATTNDEFELPVAVGETSQELAEMLGIAACNISTSIIKGRTGRKYKFFKVIRETEKPKEVKKKINTNIHNFTDRELQVFQAYQEGMKNFEIAEMLGISKPRVSNLYRKALKKVGMSL